MLAVDIKLKKNKASCLELKPRYQIRGKVQNMDPWSMCPLRGPGPSKYGLGPWTPFMDRVHGPPIMDQVHGPPIFTTPKITD